MFKRLAAYLSHRPVALQIGALVAVTALPLILVSVFMFDRLVGKERERARESLMVRAKTLATLVDNEIDTFTAIGWILAGSPKLRDGDLDGFRKEAEAAIAYVPGSWIALSKVDGQMVFRTNAPPGAAMSSHPNPEILREAVSTGKPQVADLDLSSFASPAPYVEIPAHAGGPPQYSVEVVMNPTEFVSLFGDNTQNGEIVGLIDRKRHFIARIPDHTGRLGTPPSPGWSAALDLAPEGWTESRTLEGTPAVTAYTRTVNGWTVGIGQPDFQLSAPSRRLLSVIAVAAITLLTLSALLASLIARRITRSMSALADAASRVGAGEAVEPPEAPFAEARAIGAALAGASVELRRRGDLLARERELLEVKVADRTEELRREIALKSKVEEQLRQSQKMEALGQLAGGIAHDFNNMLAVIMASLQLLKRRLAPDDKVDRHIDAALTGADRAVTLTRRLLAFSRQQPLEPAVIDLNAVIRELTDFLQRTLGSNIELETRLAEDLWPVNIDPRQFELALVNLAVNARDAMESSGGRLAIETRNTGTDRMSAALGSDSPESAMGPAVVVSVIDTGTGMDTETLARASEPFFTTKPVGKGTGLGLSQVHGFAQQSDGQLRLWSQPGEGATAEVWFPRHEGDGAEHPADATGAPRARPGERVLVVDDVDQVRALVVEALQELGYDTVEAQDGTQALALLAAAPSIDLMLTDIVMPGMTGRDLAQAARADRPDLRVVYMTGFARSAVMKNRDLRWEGGLLRKPFTFEQLAKAVRTALDLAA